ncbi:MAG: hypothetical protein F7B11_02760 [Caldisphaeraceae archaeon]|nr:hypothetical protein [Caldisphaeraceae archaeon]
MDKWKKAIILYTRSRGLQSHYALNKNALEFIMYAKERASYLIPLRRKHQYEANEILSPSSVDE